MPSVCLEGEAEEWGSYEGFWRRSNRRHHAVKLDALLAQRLGRDERRQALVRALAMLATDVGATLIVEGVERTNDLMHLAKTRLPLLVQGYAIARPGAPWPQISPTAGRVLASVASQRTSSLLQS